MARSSCYVRELPFFDNFRDDFHSSFAHLLHVDLHVEDSLGMTRGAGHALRQAVAGLVREGRRRRALFPTRGAVTRLYMFVETLAQPQDCQLEHKSGVLRQSPRYLLSCKFAMLMRYHPKMWTAQRNINILLQKS